MTRKYDIIIFGVTSFTGKTLVYEVLKIQGKGDSPRFGWAVAGRSVEKMKSLLSKVEADTGDTSLRKVDMIQADVATPSSIQEMVKQCSIVLNLVGPFAEYGEVVVKACAEAGTHHLDLSAEPTYLGAMELKYSKLAEENRCFIVGACGSGSIPSDCGAEALQRQFEGGKVNSVESFLKFPSDGTKVNTIHYATWHSIILLMHQATDLLRLRKQLYSSGYPPNPKFGLPRWPIQYREEVGEWCLFNPFPDGDVMERSQRYRFQNGGDGLGNPIATHFVQTKPYFQFPKFRYAFLFALFSFFVGLFAQFKFGVKLLLNHPSFFSFGFVTHAGPSEAEMEDVKMTITLVAKGWSKNNDNERGPPNKTKIMRFKGSNPMYAGASIIFLQAALTILSERDKMPKRGGVYSPGIAFAGTSLIDRLNRNGITVQMEN